MYQTVFEKMNFRNLTWGQMGKVQLLIFLKLKFIFFKFKIENFTKTKKRSRDIHQGIFPLILKKIRKLVAELQVLTDRLTDRPTDDAARQ